MTSAATPPKPFHLLVKAFAMMHILSVGSFVDQNGERLGDDWLSPKAIAFKRER